MVVPSNMDLHVGTLNGYNNLIQIATDDMELGNNAKVKPSHPSTTTSTENDFDFLQIDFEDSTSNF